MIVTSPNLGRLLRTWMLGAALALLGGCGGGVGTGGTGSEAQGPITGFGSVIVAGVTWEDSAATVLDEDGRAVTRNGEELRLGMTIEIEGEGEGDEATARTIRIDTTLVGPLDTVNVAGRVLQVLGQSVRVDAGTSFDPSAPRGLADLRPGDIVAVYAMPEASGNGQLATRIEPAAAGAKLRLRGTVAALDTSARTFRIGALLLAYGSTGGVPAGLADGQHVRIVVKAPGGGVGGPWEVVSFGAQDEAPDEGDRAQVEGIVSSFAGSGRFVVDGLSVDARGAEVRPTGAVLANGVRVQVSGRMSGGSLVAERVTVLANGDVEQRVYKLNGRIDTVNAAAETFVLRKTVVDYSNAEFVDGSASDLSSGDRVRVEGPMSADGGRLLATKVEFR
jgi:hypothetical protein